MAFENLSDKLNAAFKKLRGKGRLTAGDIKEVMREVRLALLEADVSYKVVKDFTKTVTERASGAEVLEALSPAQMVVKIVNEELCSLMGGENQKLNISSKSPSVVMLVGLQGAGKTTNGAKLAAMMRKQGKRPLLAACDIYRPAAIKQLETVGAQLDIPVFQMGQTDPVEIAKAAIEHAKKHGNDLVFLDTAGRLHIDEDLMNELCAIRDAVEPAEILLVVDAMTGQDAVNAATAFDEKLGVTGQVLIKSSKPLEDVAQRMAGHSHNVMYMPVVNIQKESGMKLFKSYLEQGTIPLAYEVCWSSNNDGLFPQIAGKILAQGSQIWVNTIWASLCGGLGNDDDAAFECEDPGEVYQQYIDAGVSMIQTDRPELLIGWLKKTGHHSL